MNFMVLAPVLRRLNESGLVLPHMADLKLEVGSLFQKTGLTTAGDKEVYKVLKYCFNTISLVSIDVSQVNNL